jgi:hypothetical protein
MREGRHRGPSDNALARRCAVMFQRLADGLEVCPQLLGDVFLAGTASMGCLGQSEILLARYVRTFW